LAAETLNIFITNLNLIVFSLNPLHQKKKKLKTLLNWVSLYKTFCEPSLLSADLDTQNIRHCNKALGAV
jgi:hypothetical protein